MDTGWFQDNAVEITLGILTAALTAIGLYLAHNRHRAVSLAIAESRHDAYAELWSITGAARPSARGRGEPLTPEDMARLHGRLGDWYFGNAGGLLLSEPARKLLFRVRYLLIEPAGDEDFRTWCGKLATLQRAAEASLLPADRGDIVTRQLSLLRTQLKLDFVVYVGRHRDWPSELDRAIFADADLPMSRWR